MLDILSDALSQKNKTFFSTPIRAQGPVRKGQEERMGGHLFPPKKEDSFPQNDTVPAAAAH